MAITHITSLSQLDAVLDKSKTKLTVIDFHATWCGPCHAIAPVFEALSKQYADVNFLKCDVDAAQDVARRYSVSAMPTFVFLKGQTKVDQVRGANRACVFVYIHFAYSLLRPISAIENALGKHTSGSGSSSFSGRGQSLGESSAATPAPGNATWEVPLGNIDPQVKKLLYFLGAYLLFWYLSR
ncbi:thioredoxin-domain-containing protein [Russula dissimulans]|nr:thioredoxin-domain-containing protein [Russula dissimulans]